MFAIDTAAPPRTTYTRPAEPFTITSVTRAGVADRSREKWDRVIRSLRGLAALRDNWDGQGAAAPSARLIRSAVEFAEDWRRHDIPPPTTAAPTPAGTVLFTWEGSPYFEVEIVAPYQAEWMFVDLDEKAIHGEFC